MSGSIQRGTESVAYLGEGGVGFPRWRSRLQLGGARGRAEVYNVAQSQCPRIGEERYFRTNQTLCRGAFPPSIIVAGRSVRAIIGAKIGTTMGSTVRTTRRANHRVRGNFRTTRQPWGHPRGRLPTLAPCAVHPSSCAAQYNFRRKPSPV